MTWTGNRSSQPALVVCTVIATALLLLVSLAEAQRCSATTRCASASLCCSKYGWCGTSDAHCGAGCINGACYQCGSKLGGKRCAGGKCCSQYGFCGSTSAYCGVGCQSNCNRSSSPPPLPPPPAANSFRRGAYFPIWSPVQPSTLPAKRFTHLFFAFAAIHPTQYTVIGDPNYPLRLYPIFNSATKATNPTLKTLISIGGGDEGSTTRFSTLAARPSLRSAFAQSAVAFARAHSFDGIDVDWEFPTNRAAAFSSLLQDLRKAIDSDAAADRSRPALLLTAAVAAWEPNVQSCYDVPTVNRLVDWVNVMTYDLHGEWEKVVGLHTALTDAASPQLSIRGGVSAWLERGMAKSKVRMGLAMYGRSWTLAAAGRNEVGAAAVGAGAPGPITQDAGTLAYKEIAAMIASGGTAKFHTPSSSMYAYKGTQWVGYDNPTTVATKVKYAQSQGLGGYFFWSLDQDHKYALTDAAAKVW